MCILRNKCQVGVKNFTSVYTKLLTLSAMIFLTPHIWKKVITHNCHSNLHCAGDPGQRDRDIGEAKEGRQEDVLVRGLPHRAQLPRYNEEPRLRSETYEEEAPDQATERGEAKVHSLDLRCMTFCATLKLNKLEFLLLL